jgi:hypothetical protein
MKWGEVIRRVRGIDLQHEILSKLQHRMRLSRWVKIILGTKLVRLLLADTVLMHVIANVKRLSVSPQVNVPGLYLLFSHVVLILGSGGDARPPFWDVYFRQVRLV